MPPLPDLNRANTANRAHVSVIEGYGAWAATYDADHNPLQAVDSIQLRRLLPEFVGLIHVEETTSIPRSRPQLVDLGCGTGRNTAQLVALLLDAANTGSPAAFQHGASVLAVDLTPAMLDVAESKCTRLLEAAPASTRARLDLRFRCFDMLKETPNEEITANSEDHSPAARQPEDISWGAADGVLSSLVIEHVPAPVFFRTCAVLLRPGGYLLATNMHPDMGRATGSGYTDQSTGGKVRIEGYNHAVQEFADEAAKAGFVLQGNGVQEAGPTEAMIHEEESLRYRGAKWVGINIWMGAIWRKA